jgi:hypothetical protein
VLPPRPAARGEASASGVEALWLAEKLLKHILDDVFRINCGEEAMHKPDHVGAVTLKCFDHRLRHLCTKAEHQLSIAGARNVASWKWEFPITQHVDRGMQ